MKTTLSLLSFAALVSISFSAFAADRSLSPADKQFLGAYEGIRAALAADDLNSAKKTAESLGAVGVDLAKSKSLEDARVAFATLSNSAEKITTGEPGYYVFHCSMVNKDWVQTSPKVANPYTGQQMPGCGALKS
jgi:hypothetical protein